MTIPVEDPQASLFASILKRLLRPLVRALISNGVTAPAFYQIVKSVYVEVAEADFPLEGKRQTDSRITILTGVHRRDVHAMRNETLASDAAVQRKVSTIASVTGAWLGNPATTDAQGNPLPLPRMAQTGPSFESLVQSVSRDIRPRTILEELLRQKLLHEAKDGMLILHADAFVGPADTAQKVHFFGDNVGDHIAAAVENLLAPEPPFMERAVFYNKLTPASVDRIETQGREQGMALLKDINRLAASCQSADDGKPDATERLRLGVFFYRAGQSPNAVDPDAELRKINDEDGVHDA